MALPPSKLTEVISGLADDFSMKARAIPSMLKKAGVKDEELKFANLGLPDPTEGKAMEAWTKDNLVEANAKRTDKQDVIVRKGGKETDYGKINVTSATPDYEERIYTFGLPTDEGGQPLFRSEHFPDAGKNYLAHTRIQPIDLNGKKVRTILELQSDLHAANRNSTTVTNDSMSTLDKEITMVENGDESLIKYYGDKETAIAKLQEQKQQLQAQNIQVKAPYEDSINRKLIERELFNAIEEGAQHSAIPLSGSSVENLHRSPEIQSMYENQIKNTAIKIAKQQGLPYRVETKKLADSDVIFLKSSIEKFAESGDRYARSNLLGLSSRLNSKDLKTLTELHNSGKISTQEFKEQANKVADDLGKGTDYLVIDHPKGTKLDVNLYAAPAATAGAAYLAYQAGYKQEEVETYLVEKQGYQPEEAKQLAEQTKQAIDAGYSQEEITAHFSSKEVTEPVQDEVKKTPPPAEALAKPVTTEQAEAMSHGTPTLDSRYYNTIYQATTTQAENAKELIASQEVLRPAMVSAMQHTKAFAGYDNKTNELVAKKVTEQRQQIIDFAAQKGMQLEYDPNTVGWKVMTENGWQEATPSIFKSVWKSKGELAGYVAGAAIGSRAGKIAGVAIFPEIAPISGTAGFVLGGLLGGAGGAVVGNDFDYIYESMTHNVEMDAAVQQQRQINAAQASLLYDVIGGIAMKTPSAVLSVTKAISDIPEAVRAGIEGEKSIDKALANTMFVNKDEANDLVRVMERFSNLPGKSELDKRVTAAIYSLPGSEGVAGAAARVNPLASRSIAKTIDNRAQDLLRASEDLTDENLTRIVQQDLKNYEDDVKNLYTTVKSKAAESAQASNYTFNIDALAINPVITDLQRNIDDPRIMERFLLQVNRIQQFSASRNFNDLLELRKVVNGFKFNTKIASGKDYERLNAVVGNIDAAIEDGATKVMPNSKEWLGEFKEANLQYAQMLNVKKNVLYKSLVKPGQNYDTTVSALTRYINAEDSTFMDVVAKLPVSTKAKVEGSVINALTEKFTAGTPGGERAVYFPQLSQALNDLPLTTPEVRKFKGAVNELSEVFRNDVPLAAVSGSLRAPTDTSILTSDLLAATKRTIASKVFNFAKRTIGSDSSKLIYKAAEVLENPLNSKSMKELMEQLDGQINIDAEAKALLEATAKEQSEKGFVGAPKVILYGDGSVLSAKAGTGSKQTIALHRIASIEQAVKIAEAQGINPADTKLVDAALTSLGYKAVQQGADKVRVLK